MANELMDKAKKLASRPYAIEIMSDKTTTGERIYLLSHPELSGCMAQGMTIEEAENNLSDATKEYILSLLEDDLPIPVPNAADTFTTSAPYITIEKECTYPEQDDSFVETLGNVSQPLKREQQGKIAVISVVNPELEPV